MKNMCDKCRCSKCLNQQSVISKINRSQIPPINTGNMHLSHLTKSYLTEFSCDWKSKMNFLNCLSGLTERDLLTFVYLTSLFQSLIYYLTAVV